MLWEEMLKLNKSYTYKTIEFKTYFDKFNSLIDKFERIKQNMNFEEYYDTVEEVISFEENMMIELLEKRKERKGERNEYK